MLVSGNGRVLVMDDEASVATAMKRMLERLGYQADCVGDGVAALDAYRQALEEGRPYAAVIMDLTIPGGLGGKETIGRLKALDPGAKAIVSTGYSYDPILSEDARHGFSAVLRKPYGIQELSDALDRTIGSAEPD